MSSLSCSVAIILGQVLRVFGLLMLVYAVVSWVPSLQGRWSSYVARVVEPVLMPLRRIIPPIGGIDLSFLIVILLVGYLTNAIPRAACSVYY
jgi:YggT family protein